MGSLFSCCIFKYIYYKHDKSLQFVFVYYHTVGILFLTCLCSIYRLDGSLPDSGTELSDHELSTSYDILPDMGYGLFFCLISIIVSLSDPPI
jgi:hypothetical protein